MLPPSGQDSLDVRQAYLRHQRISRRFSDRGLVALWVALGTIVAWLFIAAFAGLGGH
jgi:hypothetical protein